ncbi:pitrilysin family protein [Flavivirga sp. 57AJ16]|uniref:M16 family metallopeptidase n=1 Tax=Flavivirga sp. 57AJ16 TaxID=3025307 RepID=UPI0023671B4E|nr:M16 family metallopeptidase [Flavivirga sp. 57AJ16]MDD7885098.1 insulinase family protein [Flavivirga sp. 57AJ16]
MKRILIFTFSLLMVFGHKGFTQPLDYNEKLPVDKTIKKGVLPNGMTYYIKSTDVVKDAASYYIIQNVGSILEDDDQRGLAHFLEHMAFNGTENFPGKGILNTLQEHGAVFGKDINAYTAFDETVYNLNNIPTKEGLVDTCLAVLRDWSNYLLLTDGEIDAERGVIKEEWRTRQNGQMRLYQTSMPITYNDSKYSRRMPIGLMSIVENFEYKALRDFYHDWYRTDLQAIAVIGDIDVDGVEQKIIERFSKIPAVENPRERFEVNIPDNEEMLYSLGTDPEVSSASISFGIRHKKSQHPETIETLKQQLLRSVAISAISSRISEQAQKPEAPFLGARVGYGPLSRTSNVFSISVSPKENQQKEAFEAVLTEVVRAVKFGYTQSEINRAIAQIKSTYENQIAKKDNIGHGQIERAIQGNYLENKTITDVEKEYEIVAQLIPDITPDKLHQAIKRIYAQKNRYLNVTGVEKQDNLTEKEAKQIIALVENNNSLKPYSEDMEGKNLMSGTAIKKGTILEETSNTDLGSTTFVLDNGVKVHYRFVDKDKDNVALYATSYGGMSLLADADLPSASLMGNLISMSGLGDFPATDLRKVLAGKTANVKIGLGGISESISGASNTKDVETMLQMVHLYFVKPRFDEQAFQVLNSNISNYITRRSQDINEKMKDSLTVAIYGENNPKSHLFNQEYADKVSFEGIEKIYRERFADASDFEFFIVGDVKENDLKPLLEKYLASIPTNNIHEQYKDNGAEWISDNIDKDIFFKMEDPKASVNISYKKEIPHSIKNSICTKALGDILQLRVTETIREEAGGAYSPRVSASLSREPRPVAYVNFSFDCNPDLADKLTKIAKKELQNIANGNIKEEDLNKVKTNFIKEREQSKDRNSYDMALLTNFFMYNYNIDDPKNFEDIVNGMTARDVQEMAGKILNGAQTYEIVFKPLKQ